MGREPGRAKSAVGVFFNIIGTRQVGFPGRLQPRDPAPAQRIGRRIAIQQVAQEKICTQFPRQPQRKDLNRGKPHAGMIE